MAPSPLASTILFHLGPVGITRPVVTTWAIMAVLTLVSRLVTGRLRRHPDRRQIVLELLVTGIMAQIDEVIRKSPRPFLPLLGTLFIFLVAANLSGVLPGVEAPTGKLETPAALALIVFVAVHYFGVRARGPFGYLADGPPVRQRNECGVRHRAGRGACRAVRTHTADGSRDPRRPGAGLHLHRSRHGLHRCRGR